MAIPAWITRHPKVDLHCHLDGSMRMETLLDLAEKQAHPLAQLSRRQIKEHLALGKIRKDLTDYLRAFNVTNEVLQHRSSLERVAYELVEDAAKENVCHIEIRFCPFLHRKRGLDNDDVLDAVLVGMRAAAKKYSISSGVILSMLRKEALGQNREIAKLAAKKLGDGVIGLDLAGPEKGYPASEYKRFFDFAKSYEVPITIHAGEGHGADSIRHALSCGAIRIGHGTRLFEDLRLCQWVLQEQIPLEVCLTSNLQTQAVSTLATHPARQYFEQGMRVTLNTDDRLMSSTTSSREMWKAVASFGWAKKELVEITQNGIEAAFLPPKEKKKILARM